MPYIIINKTDVALFEIIFAEHIKDKPADNMIAVNNDIFKHAVLFHDLLRIKMRKLKIDKFAKTGDRYGATYTRKMSTNEGQLIDIINHTLNHITLILSNPDNYYENMIDELVVLRDENRKLHERMNMINKLATD